MVQLGLILFSITVGCLVLLLLKRNRQTEAFLQQYKRIVSSTADGIALIDRTYTYRLINQPYLDWKQKRREEIVGHTVSELLGETVFQTIVQPKLDRCLAGETIRYGEWFDFPNDQRRFVSLTYSPSIELDGMISGVVVNSRDLTDLKQAEIALQQQALQEQALSRMVQAIRNSLDLNTIFSTAVREFAELLHLNAAAMHQYFPERQSWLCIAEYLRSSESLPSLGTEIPDQNNPITEQLKWGETVVTEDTRTLEDPVNQSVAARISTASIGWLIIPLEVNGVIWGCLGGSKSPPPVSFQDDEIYLMRRFGDQLAIAIQQANLYQRAQLELTERQQAEAALYHLNQELEQRVKERTAKFQESRDLLEAIFQESIDAILLTEPASGRILNCNQRAVELFEAGDKTGLLGTVAHTLRKNPLAREQGVEILTFLQGSGVWRQECEYCTCNGHTFWGSLALKGIQVAEQRMILARITDISDRKQAEAALRQFAEREYLLRTVTQQIHQSLNLDSILASTVTEVRQMLQADRALIFHLTSASAGVVLKESVLPEYPITTAMLWEDECFPTECYTYYQQGKPRIIADVATDEWTSCLTEFMQVCGVKSKVTAPIVLSIENTSPQLWGLLVVHSCAAYRQWKPSETALLQQIANQLAIAIQQANLYQQLKTELTERQQIEAQLRTSLEEKEVLLKEVHHRVKNNLQVISSMLWLQASATQNEIVFKSLVDTRSRLQAMALIHETFYQSINLGQVNFNQYIQSLVNNILVAHTTRSGLIQVTYHLQPTVLNLETAIPCGLLLNELVTNAIKHAFPNQQAGEICITLEQRSPLEAEIAPLFSLSEETALSAQTQAQPSTHYILTVQDNGIGIPNDLDLKQLKSLGLKIAYDLTLQLCGTLTLDRTCGTRFQLTFLALESPTTLA